MALAIAWSIGAFAAALDAIPIPFAAFLVVPGLLAVALLVRRGERPDPTLAFAAALTGTVAVALLSTTVVSDQPLVVLAVPAVVAMGLVAVRKPAGMIVSLFVCTGFFGSIAAYWSLSVAPIVDLLLGGVWVATLWWYLFRTRSRPLWVWPGVALVATYIFASISQLLISPHTDLALRSYRISAWYLMALLLIAYSPFLAPHHLRIARGFIIVALLVGCYATLRWLTGQSGTETSYALSQSANELVGDKISLIGSFVTRKQLAMWTAMVIPFCLAFSFSVSGRWRYYALGAVATCSLAMLASDVRVGVVAVLPALVVVLGMYQVARAFSGLHLGTTLFVAFVVTVSGVGAFALTLGGGEQTSTRYKVLVTDPTRDPSYQARVFKWNTALKDIRHHPLGQGLGVSGNIQRQFGRFENISTIDVDNSYLKVALEQGFAVMLFFAASLLALLWGLGSRALTTTDPHRASLAIGAVGSLVVLSIFMFAGTYIEGLPALAGWMIIGLGVGQFAWHERAPAADTVEAAA